VADRVRLPVEVAVSMLRQLADAGFLELRDAQWSSGDEEWNTTLAGGCADDGVVPQADTARSRGEAARQRYRSS